MRNRITLLWSGLQSHWIKADLTGPEGKVTNRLNSALLPTGILEGRVWRSAEWILPFGWHRGDTLHSPFRFEPVPTACISKKSISLERSLQPFPPCVPPFHPFSPHFPCLQHEPQPSLRCVCLCLEDRPTGKQTIYFTLPFGSFSLSSENTARSREGSWIHTTGYMMKCKQFLVVLNGSPQQSSGWLLWIH